MKVLAYAGDLIPLMDNVNELQKGIEWLNDSWDEFGMKISV